MIKTAIEVVPTMTDAVEALMEQLELEPDLVESIFDWSVLPWVGPHERRHWKLLEALLLGRS